MMFPDGEKRAGFFEKNIFKRIINTIIEYDEYMKHIVNGKNFKIPPEFREEIEEYVNELNQKSISNNNDEKLNIPSEVETDNKYIDHHINAAEKEDANEE
jgi:hypothetical protein